MIRSLRGLFAIGTALTLVGVLRSGDRAELRAIVDKAIKAHGGEAFLKKHPARTMKGTGTFYGLGDGLKYTGEWFIQGDKQQRFTIDSDFNGMNIKIQQVVNGDKGWHKFNDEKTQALARDELAAEKDKIFAGFVGTLLPLKDKSFELALVGEAKVGDRQAVGIRVSKKGHQDVNLYFDKQSSLLVKSETRVKDVKLSEEYQQTSYLQEYKQFKGGRYPTKILIEKDGKKLVEGVMTDIQPLEKLEDSVFAAPQ